MVRKLVVGLMLGGLPLSGLLVAGSVPVASADSCAAPVNPAFTDSSGNQGIQVCVDTGYGLAGTVTAAGSTTPSGYVVADGAAENPEPLDGYAGVDNNGPTACSSGDYTPGAGALPTDPGCAPQTGTPGPVQP